MLLLALFACADPPVDDSACAPLDEATFQDVVWDRVLGQQCVLCHHADGAAAATGMVFLPEGADGWLAHDLEVASAAAHIGDPDPSMLAKPSGQHIDGHGGGTIFREGSEAWNVLSWFTARERGELSDCALPDALATCDATAPGQRLLRRLTHREYQNTVLDLFGIEVDALGSFVPDDVVGGLSTDANALTVSELLADDYRSAAEAIAAAVDITALAACAAGESDQSCAARFLSVYGVRILRRPLTSDDHDRYLALYDEVAAEDGFEEGLRWVLAALLQSPHFLYRMELGAQDTDGTFVLTDWEVATALAFLLTGSTPDDALLAAAEDGTLADPEGLRAQAERLLADPRAAQRPARFVSEWLALDRIATVSRDATTYPELTDSLRTAMAEETERLVEDVAASGGTVSDLLLADHTWVNGELAAYYGISDVEGEDYVSVPVDGVMRGGLLTQASVLTVYALSNNSSPIHRGLMVRERLLCEELPDPPAGVTNSLSEEAQEATTNRERYAMHSEDPLCAACHDKMDPIGFGFEHYDGIGRWRDTENGVPVDATGELVIGTDAVPFDGVLELSALLAARPEVNACATRVWFEWAAGLHDDATVSCVAEAAAAQDPAGMPLAELPLAFLDAAAFRTRAGDPSEADTPAR